MRDAAVLDQPDIDFELKRAQLSQSIAEMKPMVRQIALSAVPYYAASADHLRAAFAYLLLRTALVALG